MNTDFLTRENTSAPRSSLSLPSLTSYVIQNGLIDDWKVVRITNGTGYDHARGIDTEAQAREIADALNRNAATSFLRDTIKGLGSF